MNSARDDEDQRLLAEGEYATLLTTYYDQVVERCRLRVGPEAAHEVAHRVFLRLLEELSRGKQYRVPFRVVVHNVIKWLAGDYRSEQRGARSRENPVDPADLDPADGRSQDAFLEAESDEIVQQALDRLPPRDREVAWAVWFGGETHAEVAERLGIARNAVDQSLHRARRRLRESFDG